MRTNRLFAIRWAVVLSILIIAGALRVPRLSLRPLHTDEAVHAYKFAELLNCNEYRYDPWEYHGPTLNYFTLAPARLVGQTHSAQVTETVLRLTVVLFGLLLVVGPLLLAREISWPGALLAAGLTAVSPVMAFYSRYYIQEMLFACFCFLLLAAFIRFVAEGRRADAVLCGVALGLTHATKETCIITWAALAGAYWICRLVTDRDALRQLAEEGGGKAARVTRWIPVVLAGLAVSALFFSSFGCHPRGILDSVLTYLTYFNRGAGQTTAHIQPWWFYFERLLWFRMGSGPFWSEGVILILGLVGLTAAFNRRLAGRLAVWGFALRLIALFTLLQAAAYTAIPYKTPWCFLGPWQGMLLLAGAGGAVLGSFAKSIGAQALLTTALAAAMAHLGWQSVRANFIYYDDHANPWVYAHTHRDIFEVVDRVRDIAAHNPQGTTLPIQVIGVDHDYWPLPWCLRGLNVTFAHEVRDDVYTAPLIIAAAGFEKELVQKLYQLPPPGQKHMYVPLFSKLIWLRPQVELRGYVRKDLLDAYEQIKAGPPPAVSPPSPRAPEKKELKMDKTVESDEQGMPDLPRFAHEAMAAPFEIVVDHPDLKLCEQAAIEAFKLLDDLEQKLSRHIPNSDISRINNAAPGEPVVVSLDTLEVLAISRRMYDLTGGVFDITVGALKDCWFDKGKKMKTPTPQELERARQCYGMPNIHLDPQSVSVIVERRGLMLDLGGIGKGYAADRMGQVMEAWGIGNYMIIGGRSTILVKGLPVGRSGWRLNFRHPLQPQTSLGQIDFTGPALAASSNEQGWHIIDPRSATPARSHLAAWASAPDAATADALSTAFMILDTGTINQICETSGQINGLVVPADAKKPSIIGSWQTVGLWVQE